MARRYSVAYPPLALYLMAVFIKLGVRVGYSVALQYFSWFVAEPLFDWPELFRNQI